MWIYYISPMLLAVGITFTLLWINKREESVMFTKAGTEWRAFDGLLILFYSVALTGVVVILPVWASAPLGVYLLAKVVSLQIIFIKGYISHEWYWELWADAEDGGIDDVDRRRKAWIIFDILNHFGSVTGPEKIMGTAYLRPK